MTKNMTRKKKAKRPEQEGDVIGISHATGAIPHANIIPGGHPRGIEIERDRDQGLDDVPQGSGATSIDMGAGGEGNAVKRRH